MRRLCLTVLLLSGIIATIDDIIEFSRSQLLAADCQIRRHPNWGVLKSLRYWNGGDRRKAHKSWLQCRAYFINTIAGGEYHDRVRRAHPES